MPSVMKRDIAIVKDSEDESNSMDSDSRGEEEVSFVWLSWTFSFPQIVNSLTFVFPSTGKLSKSKSPSTRKEEANSVRLFSRNSRC